MAKYYTDTFEYNEPKNSWTAHVTFRDEARQDPFELNFYIWELGDSWIKQMEEVLEKSLGYPVEVIHKYYGNGHGSYDLQRKTDTKLPDSLI